MIPLPTVARALPALLLTGLLAGTAAHGAAAARRPNFLLIITDDQAAQGLKAYEPASPLETPVLDRLAAEGMTLDGAHHMGAFISAVCTPSRHMIMTGRTLWHLPASLTSHAYAGYPAARCPPGVEQNSLPAVFNRAGYATMRTCKRGDWKLVKFDVLDGKVRQTQLFNLAENPYELLDAHRDPKVIALTGRTPAENQRNLAADPRHAAKRRELEALLLAEMRRHEDPYRLWDQPADGLTPPIDARPPPSKKPKSG